MSWSDFSNDRWLIISISIDLEAVRIHHKHLDLFRFGIFVRHAQRRTFFDTQQQTKHTPSERGHFQSLNNLPVQKPKNVAQFFGSLSAHVDDKHRNTWSWLGVMLPDVSPAVNHIIVHLYRVNRIRAGTRRRSHQSGLEVRHQFSSFTSRRVSLASWQGPLIPRWFTVMYLPVFAAAVASSVIVRHACRWAKNEGCGLSLPSTGEKTLLCWKRNTKTKTTACCGLS